MAKGKYAFLTKNIGLFSLGTILPKVLSFVLIPLYTLKLSTFEFGVVDLVHTTVQLLIPFFTLVIHDAVMRFVFDEEYEKRHVFSGAFWIVLAGTALVLAGTVLLSVLGILSINCSYIIYMLLLFLCNGLHNVMGRFCRGIDRIGTIVTAGILQPVVVTIGNVLFLVVYNLGIIGYIIAEILGFCSAILCLFFGAKLYRYITIKVPRKVIFVMASFSIPMIFSSLAWWVNNASDRYILSWLAGVSVSGVYAVSSKIPAILSLTQHVFQQAWSISAIKEFDKHDTDGFIGNIFTLLNVISIVACSAIMICNIPIAKILYSGEFFEAWHYVPALLVAVLFNGISLYLDGIFLAAKDTKLISLSTVLGAGVNTILNFSLIGPFGAYGAAIATVVGYGAGLLYRMISLKKHICIKTNWVKLGSSAGLLGVQMVLGFWGMKLVLLQGVIFVALLLFYKKEIMSTVLMLFEKVGIIKKG